MPSLCPAPIIVEIYIVMNLNLNLMLDGRRLSEILTEFCTRRENFAQIDTFEEIGEEKLHFPQDSIRLMLEMGKVDLLAGIYFKIGCVTFLLAVLKDTRPTIYVMILSVNFARSHGLIPRADCPD